MIGVTSLVLVLLMARNDIAMKHHGVFDSRGEMFDPQWRVPLFWQQCMQIKDGVGIRMDQDIGRGRLLG